MEAHLNYADVEHLCEELLSQYADMSNYVRHFNSVLEKYRDELEDSIMEASQKILQDIKLNMSRINDYITDFTERKQSSVHEIGNIEKMVQREVNKIGR